jgi:hypothetical protein
MKARTSPALLASDETISSPWLVSAPTTITGIKRTYHGFAGSEFPVGKAVGSTSGA